jgi:hypothetical protein
LQEVGVIRKRRVVRDREHVAVLVGVVVDIGVVFARHRVPEIVEQRIVDLFQVLLVVVREEHARGPEEFRILVG